MEQAKASGKILIVDLIMSIFLWSQIFRAILALQKKKNTPVRLWHEAGSIKS